MMNCVCLIVLQFALNTWATVYFRLDQFPSWVEGASLAAGNLTTSCAAAHRSNYTSADA